jgi:hypothetical protein
MKETEYEKTKEKQRGTNGSPPYPDFTVFPAIVSIK